VLVAEIATIRSRAVEYQENRDLVRAIIAEGCEKARDVARQTLEEVHQAMGMNYR
jgi:tryptophanyl-tRNA synthetase